MFEFFDEEKINFSKRNETKTKVLDKNIPIINNFYKNFNNLLINNKENLSNSKTIQEFINKTLNIYYNNTFEDIKFDDLNILNKYSSNEFISSTNFLLSTTQDIKKNYKIIKDIMESSNIFNNDFSDFDNKEKLLLTNISYDSSIVSEKDNNEEMFCKNFIFELNIIDDDLLKFIFDNIIKTKIYHYENLLEEESNYNNNIKRKIKTLKEETYFNSSEEELKFFIGKAFKYIYSNLNVKVFYNTIQNMLFDMFNLTLQKYVEEENWKGNSHIITENIKKEIKNRFIIDETFKNKFINTINIINNMNEKKKIIFDIKKIEYNIKNNLSYYYKFPVKIDTFSNDNQLKILQIKNNNKDLFEVKFNISFSFINKKTINEEFEKLKTDYTIKNMENWKKIENLQQLFFVYSNNFYEDLNNLLEIYIDFENKKITIEEKNKKIDDIINKLKNNYLYKIVFTSGNAEFDNLFKTRFQQYFYNNIPEISDKIYVNFKNKYINKEDFLDPNGNQMFTDSLKNYSKFEKETIEIKNNVIQEDFNQYFLNNLKLNLKIYNITEYKNKELENNKIINLKSFYPEEKFLNNNIITVFEKSEYDKLSIDNKENIYILIDQNFNKNIINISSLLLSIYTIYLNNNSIKEYLNNNKLLIIFNFLSSIFITEKNLNFKTTETYKIFINSFQSLIINLNIYNNVQSFYNLDNNYIEEKSNKKIFDKFIIKDLNNNNIENTLIINLKSFISDSIINNNPEYEMEEENYKAIIYGDIYIIIKDNNNNEIIIKKIIDFIDFKEEKQNILIELLSNSIEKHNIKNILYLTYIDDKNITNINYLDKNNIFGIHYIDKIKKNIIKKCGNIELYPLIFNYRNVYQNILNNNINKNIQKEFINSPLAEYNNSGENYAPVVNILPNKYFNVENINNKFKINSVSNKVYSYNIFKLIKNDNMLYNEKAINIYNYEKLFENIESFKKILLYFNIIQNDFFYLKKGLDKILNEEDLNKEKEKQYHYINEIIYKYEDEYIKNKNLNPYDKSSYKINILAYLYQINKIFKGIENGK